MFFCSFNFNILMEKILKNLEKLEKIVENEFPVEIDSDGKMFKLNDDNFRNYKNCD